MRIESNGNYLDLRVLPEGGYMGSWVDHNYFFKDASLMQVLLAWRSRLGEDKWAPSWDKLAPEWWTAL